mgnify:CR=1 FL=1
MKKPIMSRILMEKVEKGEVLTLDERIKIEALYLEPISPGIDHIFGPIDVERVNPNLIRNTTWFCQHKIIPVFTDELPDVKLPEEPSMKIKEYLYKAIYPREKPIQIKLSGRYGIFKELLKLGIKSIHLHLYYFDLHDIKSKYLTGFERYDINTLLFRWKKNELKCSGLLFDKAESSQIPQGNFPKKIYEKIISQYFRQFPPKNLPLSSIWEIDGRSLIFPSSHFKTYYCNPWNMAMDVALSNAMVKRAISIRELAKYLSLIHI